MKNKAGFKVGDKVRYLMPIAGGIKSLKGLTGTIKYVYDIGADAMKQDRDLMVFARRNNPYTIETLEAIVKEIRNAI